MTEKMKRVRIEAQSLLARLGGLTLPGVGGVSWKAPESERKVVRDAIKFLEDRRALYVDFDQEIQDQVVSSLLNIRTELTSALQRVSEGSPAAGAFKVMRAACRQFLTEPHTHPDRGRMLGRQAREEDNFFAALGKLRGVFGQQIAALAYLYRVEVEEQLASILPPEPKDDDGDEGPERRHWRY